MSTQTFQPPPSRPARERPLQRRLFGWILVLTLVPALSLLAVGGWALATSLDLAGALGPWEEVGASGRRVVELAEPAADSTLASALSEHRDALSRSLTQARRWAFLGERFLQVLPFLMLGVALVLIVVASAASRRLARQLARPIEDLVGLAERLGREEPLPPPPRKSVREVRALDESLRLAASRLAEARERALMAERLRVWGEMARRVAHEMKNPLTPLRLAVHRLQRAADPAAAEAVEVIGQEVRRLEELAAQFSTLGRPSEGPPTDVDVRELLQSLLETDVPPGTEVTLDAPDGLPPIRAHYDALVRAFRNLVRNGLEAMESSDTPRLEVSLRAERGPDGARWLDARIRDFGAGLPPDGSAGIFEPDFTTKKRGTGLGLALVRQAVEAHGGEITAHDRDPGAEFVVRLPAEWKREEPPDGDEETV